MAAASLATSKPAVVVAQQSVDSVAGAISAPVSHSVGAAAAAAAPANAAAAKAVSVAQQWLDTNKFQKDDPKTVEGRTGGGMYDFRPKSEIPTPPCDNPLLFSIRVCETLWCGADINRTLQIAEARMATMLNALPAECKGKIVETKYYCQTASNSYGPWFHKTFVWVDPKLLA